WRCKYSNSGMRCLSHSRFSAMALFSPPESRLGGKQRASQARMVGGAPFLNAQGPEASEKRVYGVPPQGQRIVDEPLGPAEPSVYGLHRLAQTRKRRLGRIQLTEPAAKRGGVGHAIRVFDCGRRSFPATAFQEVPLECLAAGDEAVMAIRRREGRQEGECLVARPATA